MYRPKVTAKTDTRIFIFVKMPLMQFHLFGSLNNLSTIVALFVIYYLDCFFLFIVKIEVAMFSRNFLLNTCYTYNLGYLGLHGVQTPFTRIVMYIIKIMIRTFTKARFVISEVAILLEACE